MATLDLQQLQFEPQFEAQFVSPAATEADIGSGLLGNLRQLVFGVQPIIVKACQGSLCRADVHDTL